MKSKKKVSANGSTERITKNKFSKNQIRDNKSGDRKEMQKMKTLTVMVTLFVLFVFTGLSNAAAYRLTIQGPVQTSANSFEFSLVIKNISTDDKEFAYSLGQYFIEFNSSIANGGQLQYTLIESELPESMRPRNPAIDNDVLRLACNIVNADKSTLPIVTAKSGGLLIAKMRLQTTAESFSGDDLQLKWISADATFRTKIFAFANGVNADITGDCEFLSEDGSGIVSNEIQSELPTSYELAQNFPNPFNPSTIIRYSLPEQAFVALKVYDISGREVKTLVNEVKSAGSYEVSFNSTGLSSGMYFYRINAGSFSKVMKMVLVK
jgi:hypothetical protein